MTQTSYTPATADDFLLELSDDQLVAALGGSKHPDREDAHQALSAHVKAAYGRSPQDDTIVRVIDTLLAYKIISICARTE